MTTMLLAPDQVKPNPWQTRTSEDPAHIADLAGSIRDVGLLQTPLARLRPHGEYAELAFGHSRLAAWKLAKPGEAFPLEIRALTDRQMSDLAAEENTRRKNLSAIETAKAIQKRIDDFGLTQLEAGAPFGYKSQGSVGNLLRLLKLPESVQAHVASGELPERLARELLLVARINPKAAAEIADGALEVDSRDRGEHVTKQITHVLWNKGRRLGQVPFELDWPKTPIKVEAPNTARGEPAEIRACEGCPFRFQHEHSDLCANPACFDLKVRLGQARAVENAAKRLKIPAAAPDEKVVPIFDGKTTIKAFVDGYDGGRYRRGSEDVARVIKAQLPELRLIAAPDNSWELKHIFGSEWVGLGATNKAEVERYLAQKRASKADAPKGGNGKAAPATALHETAAQKTARIAREERLAAERRQERTVFLKHRTDTIWLVEHVAWLLAARTLASGGLLAWMTDFVDKDYRYNIGEAEWAEAERKLVAAIKAGQDVDKLRRQHLALNVLVHELTDGRYKPAEIYDYGRAHRTAAALAKTFGVELPDGWDSLPIHHTPFNCWACGRFASNSNGLTKRDQAEGWTEERKGKELLGVWCPDDSKKRQGKLLTEVFDDAAPAPNGNGHKQAKSKKSKQLTRA